MFKKILALTARYDNVSLPFSLRALGQGAFGEVYQGNMKKYLDANVEMPVAVKVRNYTGNIHVSLCVLVVHTIRDTNVYRRETRSKYWV